MEGGKLYKDKNPGWNFPEKFVTIFEPGRSKYTQEPSLGVSLLEEIVKLVMAI